MLVGKRVQRVHLVGQDHVGHAPVDRLVEAGRDARGTPVVDHDDREPGVGPPLPLQPPGAGRHHLLVSRAAVDVHQDGQPPPGDVLARVQHAGGQPPVGDPLQYRPRGVRRGRREVGQLADRLGTPVDRVPHAGVLQRVGSDDEGVTGGVPGVPTRLGGQPAGVGARHPGRAAYPEQVLLAGLALLPLHEQVAVEAPADPPHVHRRRREQAAVREQAARVVPVVGQLAADQYPAVEQVRGRTGYRLHPARVGASHRKQADQFF